MDHRSTVARVGRIEPLVHLPSGVAPAVLVGRADAGISSDRVFRVAQPSSETASSLRQCRATEGSKKQNLLCPARQPLVRRVHASREAVADELDAAVEIGQLDQLLSRSHVDSLDLHPIRPVRDAHFEGPWIDRASEIRTRRVWAHKEVSGAGSDVGEHPIQPSNAIADQDTVAGQVSKGDGHRLASVAKPDSRRAGRSSSGPVFQRLSSREVAADLRPPRHIFRVPPPLVRDLTGIRRVRGE